MTPTAATAATPSATREPMSNLRPAGLDISLPLNEPRGAPAFGPPLAASSTSSTTGRSRRGFQPGQENRGFRAARHEVLTFFVVWSLPLKRHVTLLINIALLALVTVPVFAASSRGTVNRKPSARIAPARSARALTDALSAIIQSGDLGRSSLGMRVIEADTGRVVFNHNPELPLMPASNMKVMTSAAALSLLRPEYVFSTMFHTTARPEDGVIKGDLYIKGSGSPQLVGEQWWLMAREMRARGITRVDGDLVGDDSYFDSRDRPAGWPGPGEDAFYNAPISALSADFSAVTIVVRPSQVGSPPEVFITPFSSFFKIVNHAVTRVGTSNLRVGRQFDGEQNTIVVEGSISSKSAPSVSYRCVEQPTMYALSAFREAAAKEGIVIKGGLRRGATPAGALKIYEHESPPLAELCLLY